MAGIMSATQRQSFALMRVAPAGLRQTLNALFCLGKGDNLRGTCIATAFILTVLGCLAPHVGAMTLTACLLLTGTGLVLVATSSLAGSEQPQFENVKMTVCDAREPIASDALARRRTFEELLDRSPGGAPGDTAHWAQLTSRMCHELRTPLNAVLGFSEIMQEEVFGPLGSPQYVDYARNIHQSGRNLLKSAEDALAITNLLTRSVVNYADAAASLQGSVVDALDFHAACLADLDIETRANIDPALEVMSDEQALRQIMINLLSEAIDRAEAGSCIVLASDTFLHEASVSVCAVPAIARSADPAESYALVLARTLALLCGARLEEGQTTDGLWCVTVHFHRAVQRDFFTHNGHR